MTLIDLNTKLPISFQKYATPNSKIDKAQKSTGVSFKWLYEFSHLQTNELEDTEIHVQNIEDRGEYYSRPEGAIGVLVHTLNEPGTFAGWYGKNNHEGFYNVYGDQPKGSQQTYYLNDAQTIFIGLF